MKTIKQVFMANPANWPGSRGRFYDVEVCETDQGDFEVVVSYGYLGTHRVPHSSSPLVQSYGPNRAAALAKCDWLVGLKETVGYTVGRGE